MCPVGSLHLIALSSFMNKTQEERLERRNATVENFTHLKTCPWASPEIKSDLIKAFPPWSQPYILMCACVPVFAFQTTKCCHTAFQQHCVLSPGVPHIYKWWAQGLRSYLLSPTASTRAPSLLTPVAAALVPSHASNLKGLQILKR